MKPGGLKINFGKSIKKAVFVAPAVSAPTATPAVNNTSQFGEDEEEDEENVDGKMNSVEAVNASQFKKSEESVAACTASGVYDYDSFFDTREKDVGKKNKDTSGQQSASHQEEMKKQLEIRKREQSLLHDRMLMKEIEREDHQFENSLKFVTGAYKRKMVEDAEFLSTLDESSKKQNLGGVGEATKTSLLNVNTSGIQIMGAYTGTFDPKVGFQGKSEEDATNNINHTLSAMIKADDVYMDNTEKDTSIRSKDATSAKERYLQRKQVNSSNQNKQEQ